MGEIRFVGTGETRGYPYLVCKNMYLLYYCKHFLVNYDNCFDSIKTYSVRCWVKVIHSG